MLRQGVSIPGSSAFGKVLAFREPGKHLPPNAVFQSRKTWVLPRRLRHTRDLSQLRIMGCLTVLVSAKPMFGTGGGWGEVPQSSREWGGLVC